MKFRVTVAMLAAMGIGAVHAQDTTSDKGKLSYAMGYEIGRDIAEREIDADLNTVVRAIQDGYAKRNPAVPEADMRAALEQMQQQMLAKAKSEFDRVAAENKTKSDQFMAANRSKQGIQALPSGIQYRIIDQGAGPQPTANSEVEIHFRGSLGSSGQEFASTYTAYDALTDEEKSP